MRKPANLMPNNALRLSIILLALFVKLVAGEPTTPAAGLSAFVNEKLDYTMIYKGLPSARAELRLERAGDGCAITLTTRTRAIFDPLFKINNRYTVTIDGAARLSTATKKIGQKNLREEMTIRYDWRKLRASVDQERGWPILPSCTNLLAMIYDLRLKNPQLGDSLSYVLDVESQLWQIDGVVTQIGDDRQIVFGFTPAQPIRGRGWRTDLLTNRLARRDSQLIMRLGPPPQNMPRWIAFGSQDNRVEMKLGK